MQARNRKKRIKNNFRISPLRDVHIRSCEEIVSSSDPWKRLHESIDFRRMLAGDRTPTVAYVCLAGPQPVGFVLFIPEPVFARGGYLRAIGVAPAFRGLGIGKKLLAFAEEMTSRRSLHLFLCASSFNKKAQVFYKQCGYEKAGALKDLLIPGAAEYIFWKRLKQKPRRRSP